MGGRNGYFLPLIRKVIYFSFSWTLLFFGAIFNHFYLPLFREVFLYSSYIPPKSAKKIKIE